MKIGIFTFHDADNYGAVLQALALQNYLKNITNHSIKIIDYKSHAIREQNKIISFKKPIRITLVNMFYFISNYIRHIRFVRFRNKYLDTTEKWKEKNIYNLKNSMDCYIVGSDQIWNIDCTEDDMVYFLNFAGNKARCLSYAASFGYYDKVGLIDLKEILNKFYAISIRENFNHPLLKQYPVHIDPSLLYNSAEWDELLGIGDSDKHYILVYTVMVPQKLLAEVLRFSKETGLPIIYINNWIKRKHMHHKRIVDPREFVQLIRNAEKVFTTSFHGTAFSLVYHKNFCVELKNSVNENMRVISLLNKCGINISNSEIFHSDNINWNQVDANLEYERRQSLTYFKENLDEVGMI